MGKQNINDDQIKLIQSDSFDAHFWFYQLGISISDIDISSENRFSFDFYNLGKEYWENIQDKLMSILCDRKNKVPKESLDEVLSGDIRNLIVYLITVIITDLGIVISVAIPIVSLLLKKGLRLFCEQS